MTYIYIYTYINSHSHTYITHVHCWGWGWGWGLTFMYFLFGAMIYWSRRLMRLSPFNVSFHQNDVIMGAMASQITSLTIVYSTVYSGAVQRKHQSSVSLAFVRGSHRWPVNSPHKWAVTREMFPFGDVVLNPSKMHFECHILQYWVILLLCIELNNAIYPTHYKSHYFV